MSVAAIVRVIEAEAADEAARILADARARAAEVVAEEERTAESRVKVALERAEPGYRAEAMRRVNASRLRLLELRAERTAALVEAAFRVAEARLAAIVDEGGPRWTRALGALIADAVALAGEGCSVAVRRADGPAAGPVVERLGVRLEPPDRRGDAEEPAGASAVSADGRIAVEATTAARLARARIALAEVVVRRLGVDD